MVDDGVLNYRPGAFALAGPTSLLVAEGERARVAETGRTDPADAVAKALADTGAPLAVGALPFDVGAPSHLVVPESVKTGGAAQLTPGSPPRLTPTRVSPDPAAPDYAAAVAAAVAELRAGGPLRKVVLARALRVAFDTAPDLAALLPGLAAATPHAHTFATPLPGGATLFGASPELLVSRRGPRVVSNPLAGSAPRGSTPAEDRERAAALAASAKDLAEHRVVVEAVADTLAPFCSDLRVPAGPSLVATPTVWHLSTRITGELADPSVSALRLASALHPTPAVCGTPTTDARRAIARLEPFDRGFYGGAVGWTDHSGDGTWVVAIRCARLAGTEMTLYAGAGIMPDSDPDAELAETSAKFATLLRGLGLPPLG